MQKCEEQSPVTEETAPQIYRTYAIAHQEELRNTDRWFTIQNTFSINEM